jgi:tetratricopeptide (TPR) repeat protein
LGGKSETIVVGPLLYLITLTPVLQLIPFNNASLVADRYAYLPVIGLAYFFSQLMELATNALKSNSVKPAELRHVFFALIILLLLVPALERVQVWKNSITLFDDVLKKNDRIGIAFGNRADAKLKEGNFSGALADCDHLVALRPDDGKAYYDRGNALLGLQMYRDAVVDLTCSIQHGFVKSSVYYNRGTAYYNLGHSDSAFADFRSSRTLDPAFADAPYSLGYVTLHSRGDARTSEAYFDSALAINPRYTEALYQKAIAEYGLRAYGNATQDLSAAISYHESLRSDPLVGKINHAIDSVNARVAALQSLPGNGPRAIETRRRLEELYMMLGDSLRGNAGNGMVPSHGSGSDR